MSLPSATSSAPSSATSQSSSPAAQTDSASVSSSQRCTLPDKIYVLYASQTGQAESISEFIFDQFASDSGTLRFIRDRLGEQSVRRVCASKYESLLDDFLQPKNSAALRPGSYLAIVVASTTGQGDPPDKANKFFRWIRRLKRNGTNDKVLSHLSYALLGLGDTNYDNFANFGHLLDRHFTDLGAQSYVPAEYADDAVGLELVTEPFIDNLTQTLLDHFSELPVTSSVASLSVSEGIAVSVVAVVTNGHSKPSDSTIEEIGAEPEDTSTINEQAASSQVDQPTIEPTEPSASEPEDKTDTKMNLTRPVVSSCDCLSSSDKISLSDLCRQLIEPSEKLSALTELELTLPNVHFSPDQSLDCLLLLLSSQHELGGGGGSTESNSADLKPKLVSVDQFLKGKVPNEAPFYRAQVKFNRKLSSSTESSSSSSSKRLCCHQEKIVLECDIEYKVEDAEEDKKKDFVPGDAFGIYSSNLLVDLYQVLVSVMVKASPDEDYILLWDFFKVAKKQVHITLSDKTMVELMPHLVFGVDLHTVPKKVTLAHFAQFTSEPEQKRRLLELSSRQGNLEYQSLILVHKLTICDIFRLFDSCHPPISVFLHYLTASRPRYFSAASVPKDVVEVITEQKTETATNTAQSSLQSELQVEQQRTRTFKIVFSVANNFTHSFMRTSEQLLGLFSGKFFKHFPVNGKTYLPDYSCTNIWKTLARIHSTLTNGSILDAQDVPLLQASPPFPVYVFPRMNKSFRITSDLTKPLIFISAGTGIAPFLSLLDQRKQLIESLSTSTDGAEQLAALGEIYFFFGCRHPYQDFTYANEIVSYSKGSVPLFKHLCLCFSRCNATQLTRFEVEHQITLCGNHQSSTELNDASEDGEEPKAPIKHVNQLVELHGRELAELIVEQDAHVYVCGDWKKMSTGLAKSFALILSKYYLAEPEPSATSPEATKYLKELQKQGKYVVDIW